MPKHTFIGGIYMKKIISVFLITLLVISVFTGCSSKEDWAYIDDKGELTVGITLFSPMNYYEDEAKTKLVGFETEFAEAVCKELGLKAKFQVIDWNSKETELKAKNIDCIWNGMTITDERKANMDISIPYLENKQVMVVKSENLEKYNDSANIAGARVVAETKSAGETVATKNEIFKDATFTAVDTQQKALMEVAAGTADIAVVDYVMSIGSIGEGTSYTNLVVTSQEFSKEQYGIAFRKDSPETLEKVNNAIKALAESGKLAEIAAKYKLQDLLIVE
ncbi:MAG: transporter substrate-binding domain-containing protein [Ruminococcaceae bacterium]|nr:transporter substrate-binding domain-containing protein [Oscillospiraceae bacterium]